MQVYTTLIMFCLQCLVHMQTRKRMRQKYGLEEEPCNDFHVTAWCAGLTSLQAAVFTIALRRRLYRRLARDTLPCPRAARPLAHANMPTWQSAL